MLLPAYGKGAGLWAARSAARVAQRGHIEHALIVCTGDSNEGSQNGDAADVAGVDLAPANAFQVSNNVVQPGQLNPPEGELMRLRMPCQDDITTPGISSKVAFAQQWMRDHPETKSIVFLCLAVNGSAYSTPGGWTVGDTLHESAIARTNAWLLAHPEYRLAVWKHSQGQRDAEGALATFSAAHEAALANWRSKVIGADTAVWVMPTLPDAWLANNPTKLDFESYLRAQPDTDPRMVIVSMSGQAAPDGQHFDGVGQRHLGKVGAQLASLKLDARVPLGDEMQHLRWNAEAGELVDPNNAGLRVIGGTYGSVGGRSALDVTGAGYRSTLELNAEEYSLGCHFYQTATTTYRHLLSFKGSETIGQVFGVGAFMHQGVAALVNFNTLNGGEPAVNTWHHGAISVSGNVGEAFLNGVSIGTIDPAAIPAMAAARRSLLVGAWNESNLADNSINGWIDNITVAPRALTEGDWAALAAL